jgi:hypothetical protein
VTVNLDLPPQVERAYLAEAQARGVSLADLVRDVLVERKPAAAASELTPEEWVREFRAWVASHENDDLPLLSDEAISREFIYAERGL